jgi:protoporphyrinogen oxidase
MSKKQAVIIGAGPAGLTAAYELLTRSDVTPIVVECTDYIGGISRTANYKGNRIDIGGHRFFSKSDRVMNWWRDRMPIEHLKGDQPDPKTTDLVMLIRNRKSRIYFLRKFFDYPLRFNGETIANLGPVRIAKMGTSYVWAMLTAKKDPKNLEDFFISRFGRELYLTFFKSYTEKVWGESCSNISAEWGAQRIKGLSIMKALGHFLKGLVGKKAKDLSQKDTETSLIEEFLYPKFGPGQMWESVAEDVKKRGGKVLLKHRATRLRTEGDRVVAVDVINLETGETQTVQADYVFSTMPVVDLITALDAKIPENVQEVTKGLMYRDFITVGLLVKKLKVTEQGPDGQPRPITDNWIYIQEPDVTVGRLQVFNNWSPYLVDDPSNMWVGMEFFCYERDPVWTKPDAEMIALAKGELAKIGIIDEADVLDATVIHMAKTYPAYFGTYDRFNEVRTFVDRFNNLFLVGRNGMHKYNNQDHSMLTAMTAVDNIIAGQTDKSNIWDVNTEQDYHETKQTSSN